MIKGGRNKVTTSPIESFTYDAAGNVLGLKRYAGKRCVDEMTYWYGNEGNQLLNIGDL